MQNNYRYDKLNLLLHLQHQRSHYKRIIEAKKYIEFANQQKHPIAKHNTTVYKDTVNRKKQDCKYEIQKQRERKQNNNKIVNRISEINRNHGILQQMYYQSQKKGYPIQSNVNKKQDRQINKFNVKLAERLLQAKPVVGTIGQWKNHYKLFKSTEKRLKKSKTNYDPQLYLRQTITSLSQNKKLSHIPSSQGRRHKTNISQTSFAQNDSIELKNLQKRIIQQKRTRKKRRKYHNKSISALQEYHDSHQQYQLPKIESQSLKQQINKIIQTQNGEENSITEQSEEYLKQFQIIKHNKQLRSRQKLQLIKHKQI